MALPSNPLHRRLALAAAGAVVLAGGAGLAYAGPLGGSPAPAAETGYATVVDGDTGPGRTAGDQDCPDRSGGAAPGESAPGDSGPGESAPGESAPSESAPGESAPSESAPSESAPSESAPETPEESDI